MCEKHLGNLVHHLDDFVCLKQKSAICAFMLGFCENSARLENLLDRVISSESGNYYLFLKSRRLFSV